MSTVQCREFVWHDVNQVTKHWVKIPEMEKFKKKTATRKLNVKHFPSWMSAKCPNKLNLTFAVGG